MTLQIMDLNAIAMGNVQLEHNSFRLIDAVKSVGEQFRKLIHAKGIEFHIIVDQQLPGIVIGDQSRLKQILFNALSNAYHCTDQGEIVVSVKEFAARDVSVEDDSAEIGVQIAVRDTGCGMDISTINAVLLDDADPPSDPLSYQQSCTSAPNGMGLLTISTLCRLMRGSLKIISNPETVGTEIHMNVRLSYDPTLDVGKTSVEQMIDVVQDSPSSRHDDTVYALANFLIVEDNESIIKFIGHMLHNEPHITFDVARNGIEALEAVRVSNGDNRNVSGSGDTLTRPYNGVLIDLVMPVLDGIEAIRRIRAAGFSSLPIVAMATAVKREQRIVLEGLGVHALLLKPFTKVQLLDVINSHRDVRTPRSTQHLPTG
jgi:CheY-like chemotaxis protein